MDATGRFALKEWAVLCAALATGRQTIVLRKGGVEEAPDGFEPQHREFWLFPTRFHQSADELVPDAAPLLAAAERDRPPEGVLRLSLYAEVIDIGRIVDEAALPRLDGLHVLAPATVRERFHYRSPGLSVLTLRVHRREEPFQLHAAPHYAGCHSWVDLRNKLPTSGLTPVMFDADFLSAAARVQLALAP